ncbi:hypothetical protein HOLleu_27958 [Holothuria leucospilota]|uniref:Ig-like domain-containing protein n=1 Tax=Holothuria leucospilota TaxID=206669 RepID=A0A9Q1BR07_HOLLE|nr:hypothetical protein HOLleu_27958 [Holothuria leucospilota]
MEWIFCYGVGLLYVLVASVCLLEVDCIVFEINNMDVNRVVYIFELNIKMTCSEPNIRNPQFEILHESSLVQETPNLKFTVTTQSVELTISQVQLMDGGEYTCRVRSMDSTDIVATASLTLNVHDRGTHCLYNDSSLNWNEGDTKKLSCYYLASFSDDFQWQVSNSSSSSVPLTSSSLYSDSEHKRILFTSVGPLKSSDNGNMYQCSHSVDYPADIAASCMFGPISVNPISATTTVIAANMSLSSVGSLSRTQSTASNNGSITNFQSTPKLMKATTSKVQSSPVTSWEPSTSSSVTSREPSTSSSVTSREPSTSSSVTSREPSTSSSTNITTTTEKPGPISMLVLLIIAVVCVLIVISCMICFIVICKCRGKNNEKEKDSEMMTNQVYDPFDGYMKPDANVLSTEKTTHPTAGSKGDVVTETPLDAKDQVGDEYDKLDHNKEKLHNHRTRPLAATRSSLLQNDSEYDKLDHSKERFQGYMKTPMSAATGSLVEKE